MTSSAPVVKGQPANVVAATGASARQDQKGAKALPDGDQSFQALFEQIDGIASPGSDPALPDGLQPSPGRAAFRVPMALPGLTHGGPVAATAVLPGPEAGLVAIAASVAPVLGIAADAETGLADAGDGTMPSGSEFAAPVVELAVPTLPSAMSADFSNTVAIADDDRLALPVQTPVPGRPPGGMADLAPVAEPTTEAAIQFAALRSRPVELQGAAQVAAEQPQSIGKPWTVMRRETHFAPVGVALQNRAAAVQFGEAAEPMPALATLAAPGAGTLPAGSADGEGAGTLGAEFDAAGVAKTRIDPGGRDTPAAPVHQIFQRLAGELEEIAGPGPSAPAFSAPGRDAAREPLRTIELALEPAGLGSVTIKLSVRHDGLRVHVDVARSEAMGLINRDKDALTALIQSAGYQIDTVTVRHVDGDRAVSALVASTPDQQPTPRDQAGSSLLQDLSSGGRFEQGQRRSDRGGDDNAAGLARSSAKGVDQGAGRTSATGIYI
ncbi:MAG: flagellar hook-length control protein FliK [Hyphomicrobiaceae bacterium]